jgi:hypothetical protein
MVTDNQVRLLMKLIKTEKTKLTAAAKAGMDVKTARKYERLGKLPSEIRHKHTWRTREYPFKDIWDEALQYLTTNSGLEAKTLFEYFQKKYPGKYQDGQLRTFQRHVKIWRALEGPPKEVFFPQEYKPGELCQSDFTYMNKLGITISGQLFNHLIYHFILPYSNWETGTICFSESFESISEGLQNALWELGGVPRMHRTDRLSAAVKNPVTVNREKFTQRYSALLRHYGIKGQMIQGGKANENGDIEQSHYRFKEALNQVLILRGSRDFAGHEEYDSFLKKLFYQRNTGRRERFEEELKVLKRLPSSRYDACKRLHIKVGPSSTIRVSHNVYSVDSRLIGENINIYLYAEYFDIYYGQKHIERIPRLRGEGNHRIQYRHIIDWLVRKPGAFENYRYLGDLFPTHRFRIAYDSLSRYDPKRRVKEYLKILHLAAKESEQEADNAIKYLIDHNIPVDFDTVNSMIQENTCSEINKEVNIDEVDIHAYDQLLRERMVG